MKDELWASMTQQNFAEIKDRKIWHYSIISSIGQISIVQAEKKFNSVCKAILNGKM